jgi:hypothetical protein
LRIMMGVLEAGSMANPAMVALCNMGLFSFPFVSRGILG